jgi:hypothetical protein
MKLIAVLALACGFAAAPMLAATPASGSPSCDGADCVPYVDRNVVQGARCVFGTRYVFGLDSSGNTLVCNSENEWVASAPLIGVRTLGAPCDGSVGAAQTPDGIPMACISGGWRGDYSKTMY